MPNFYFGNVLNILPDTYRKLFEGCSSPHQERIMIRISDTQKIIVTKEPDATGLETFLTNNLWDIKTPIACMVAVTINDEKSRYFTQTSPYVVGQYTILSERKEAYLHSIDLQYFTARFVAAEYKVTIRDSAHQTKKISLFHLFLPPNDVVSNHDLLIARIFEIFKYLQEHQNITIYSSSTRGRVVHIVLALCLLKDFDSIFCGNTPKTIAHNILIKINKISAQSALNLTEADVIAAVELTDLVYQQNRKIFQLSSIGKYSNAFAMSNVGLHGHIVTSKANTEIEMSSTESNIKPPSFWRKLMCCGNSTERDERLIEMPEYTSNSKPM